MSRLDRRQLLTAGGLAAGGLVLPRFAIGQADDRPTITIAVQQVATSASLEAVRERSNVGERVQHVDLREPDRPQPAGQARADARASPRAGSASTSAPSNSSLRKGVKFHNGDEMNADDMVFTFGPERMFGSDYDSGANKTLFTTVLTRDSVEGKKLPPEVVGIAKRICPSLEKVEAVDKYTVRFVNRVPDVTLEGRIGGAGSEIISRRGFMEAKTWIDWARKPIATGPYKVREFKPDESLILDAHDDYWGGRPPIKTMRFVVVPEVSSRINGLLAGQYDFICDVPPDQIATIEKNPKFEVQGGLITNHRITVFDKNHPQLADPRIRQAITHAIDRQAIVDSLWAGRTRVPPGLQWEFYGPMFVEGWTVPAYDPAKARELLQGRQLQGRSDPVPRAQQLLHQPGRARRRSWSRCGAASASTCRSRCARTGSRSSRTTASARCATGRTARASPIRSARSSASTGRRASSSRPRNGPTRR